jgi:hypothetical protein
MNSLPTGVPSSSVAMSERQSYLIVFRLNMEEENPVRWKAIDQSGSTLKRPTKANLVVGVVDPSRRLATTPMMITPLASGLLEAYNSILKHVEQLNHMYRDDNGYISNPARLTTSRKDDVLDKIRMIGSEIYTLLQGNPQKSAGGRPNAVHEWLDDLFRGHDGDRSVTEQSPTHHVTIVTNDFSIPWYWLNRKSYGPFLCEIASVGMLQLAYSNIAQPEHDPLWRQKVAEQGRYEALLINGDPSLPFVGEELAAVSKGLTNALPVGSASMPLVGSRTVDSVDQLVAVHQEFRPKGRRTEQVRIIHFTGHFSPDLLNGEPVDDYLDEFIQGSLVVLDGGGTSRGLKAWTDIDSTTAALIDKGATGCLVSVLPLKNDPIISEVFWGTFYSEIRLRGVSVGEALRQARCVLRERLEHAGTSNPAWLMYQLIGNPSVEPFSTAGTRASRE